jgi:hypothetical protein
MSANNALYLVREGTHIVARYVPCLDNFEAGCGHGRLLGIFPNRKPAWVLCKRELGWFPGTQYEEFIVEGFGADELPKALREHDPIFIRKEVVL